MMKLSFDSQVSSGKRRQDIVITYWKNSILLDHANTSIIVIAALSTIERKDPSDIVRELFYGENWDDPYDFQSDVYMDITSIYES